MSPMPISKPPRTTQPAWVVLAVFCTACTASNIFSGSGDGQAGAKAEPPGPSRGDGHGGPTRSDPQPKHIILFIGDGMQLEHEIAASRYLHGQDRALSFHSFEYQGFVTTWDVSSYNANAAKRGAAPYDPQSFDPALGYSVALGGDKPYPLAKLPSQDDYFLSQSATDSASSATAMMTGEKTDQGNISWRYGDPAQGQIETIAEKLRAQRHFSVGLVSSVQFNHATPAAVIAHNPDRSNYCNDLRDNVPPSLAEELILRARPEVVIGGGHPDWSPGYINRFLYNTLQQSPEYIFVERKAATSGKDRLLAGARRAASQQKKLWGLFGGKGGNIESPIASDLPGAPRISINEENPTLAQSVTAALTVLATDEQGFFLMVEQGDIDWANHQNDYARMVGCVADLNSAVEAAIEFIERPGDRLEWTNTQFIVTSDHANSYMRLNDNKILKKGDLPRQERATAKPLQNLYGAPRYTYPDQEVTYGTTTHTNELVTLYAKGAGIHLFTRYEGSHHPNTKIIDNTQIYQVLKHWTNIN